LLLALKRQLEGRPRWSRQPGGDALRGDDLAGTCLGLQTCSGIDDVADCCEVVDGAVADVPTKASPISSPIPIPTNGPSGVP